MSLNGKRVFVALCGQNEDHWFVIGVYDCKSEAVKAGFDKYNESKDNSRHKDGWWYSIEETSYFEQ